MNEKKQRQTRCVAFGWYKKQRGDFLALLGTSARPLLISAAESIGSKLLKSVGKRFWGVKEGGIDAGNKEFHMPKKNILLRRLRTLRMVQLSNGMTFYAKYAWEARNQLPERVRVRQNYVRRTDPRRLKK